MNTYGILYHMKISSYLQRFIKNLINFIHIQLFITLISIPILLCWGMPISVLTFAGNFLLSPILTLFLLLSSLIFFCELLHIPNSFLIYGLQKTCSTWLSLMQWGTKHYLVALAAPSLLIIIAIPICALLILHYKKNNNPIRGIIGYASLMIITLLFLKYQTKSVEPISNFECNNGNVTIIATNNQITLIDPGVIGRRLSAPSWCEYKLMPHLAKTYGTTTIDHLIIMQPNKIIFDALYELVDKITIGHICVPLWDGKIPERWWYSYSKFKRRCTQNGIKISYLSAKPYTLELGAQATLTVTPLPQRVSQEDFSYPTFHLQGRLGNLNPELHSTKFKQAIPKVEKTL